MAFVTRCPYCGAVWRLPDKDTAERGPVRCSSCNHSFDATRALLCVNEAEFPNLPTSTLPACQSSDEAITPPPVSMAEASSFAPVFLSKRSGDQALAASAKESREAESNLTVQEPSPRPDLTEETKSASVKSDAIDTSVKDPEPESLAETNLDKARNDSGLVHVKRASEPKLSSVGSALRKDIRGKTEPQLRIHNIGEKTEPVLTGINPVAMKALKDSVQSRSKHIVPAERDEQEVKVVMASDPPVSVADRKPSRSYAGLVSVLLAVILLATLLLVGSIVFNQKIIELIPQSRDAFTQLCGKIPCPGFYLAQTDAFSVSKTTLRPVDESGNYSLDVTLVNQSNFAQAVPWLELELLDDNNGSLMKRTLSPHDYLSDPQSTKSLAPNRSLTIRVSLQTNVTSARCVVTPTYPKK